MNQFKTIDEYVKTFPKDVRSILERVRQTIREAAPEAVEAISYQMPTFKLNGKKPSTFRGIQKPHWILSDTVLAWFMLHVFFDDRLS